MRRPRVRIWWVMVVVVLVAVGCKVPSWWQWHHQMLLWSDTWRAVAANEEAKARRFRLAAEASAKADERQIHLEIAAGFDDRARQCRRFATFPWLDLSP